jgi:hypothetical protein
MTYAQMRQRGTARIHLFWANTRETGRSESRSHGEGAPFPGGLRGLCVSCDLRFGCTYPKPPGGVWNCDEYV